MALKAVCREYHLPLYLDGARLAYALACPQNNVTLADLASICDVFYIGGTKCGALFGEAVVIPDPALLPHFFTIIKQHGALLAKGRVLGIQFDALFTDDLYLHIGKPAQKTADMLRALFDFLELEYFFETPTNQIFIVLENEQYEKIKESVDISFWEPKDAEHTVVRFATSWATTEQDVADLTERLIGLLR